MKSQRQLPTFRIVIGSRSTHKKGATDCQKEPQRLLFPWFNKGYCFKLAATATEHFSDFLNLTFESTEGSVTLKAHFTSFWSLKNLLLHIPTFFFKGYPACQPSTQNMEQQVVQSIPFENSGYLEHSGVPRIFIFGTQLEFPCNPHAGSVLVLCSTRVRRHAAPGA